MTISRMLGATMIAGATTTSPCAPDDVRAATTHHAALDGEKRRVGASARARSTLRVVVGQAMTRAGVGAR